MQNSNHFVTFIVVVLRVVTEELQNHTNFVKELNETLQIHLKI